MDSARPPKIPGWIVVVRENFAVNKRVSEKINNWNCIKGFCLFSFSNFIFGFHGFCLRENLELNFELACGRKFSGEQ